MGKHRGLKSKWAKTFFEAGEAPASASALHPHACVRCGVVLNLALDSVTGRLDFTPCIRHLVGETELGVKRDREGEALGQPLDGVACSAGLLVYDADAAWYLIKRREGAGSAGGGPDRLSDAQLKAADEIRVVADRIVDLAQAVRKGSERGTTRPAAIIGLLNPKTPANFGAILRACGCYSNQIGQESACVYDCAVIYSDSRLQRAMNFQEESFSAELSCDVGNRAQKGSGVSRTDTMAAGQRIPQWHLSRFLDFAPLIDAVRDRIQTAEGVAEGGVSLSVRFIAVDLIDGAQSLPLFAHGLGDTARPEVVVYLFGPEDGSIPPSVIAKCDGAVFINTTGSLNLSATVNVLLYDRQAKWEQIACAAAGGVDLSILFSRQVADPNPNFSAKRNSNNKTHF